jgi:hypothetical protein
MKRILIATLILVNIFTQIKSQEAHAELTTLLDGYVNQNENFLEAKTLKAEESGCWLKAIGRGVGKVIHTCQDNLVQSGLLCYPKCKEDYTGVGPVCWQNCQQNFRNDGAFCFKTPAYGRGAGYIPEDKCKNENSQGCEKNGLLFYPKCKEGYHAFGCCICTPVCQKGMTDIGISCQKDAYGRGVGEPLRCDKEQDNDLGLCYKKCDSKYKGIGPVCWQESCPEGFEQCGALCLKGKKCSAKLKQYFDGVISIITAFSQQNYPMGVIDIAMFAKDFIYPICPMK